MPLLLELPGVALISQFLCPCAQVQGCGPRHQGGSKGGAEARDLSRGVWHPPTECIHWRAWTNTFGTTTTTSPLSPSPLPLSPSPLLPPSLLLSSPPPSPPPSPLLPPPPTTHTPNPPNHPTTQPPNHPTTQHLPLSLSSLSTSHPKPFKFWTASDFQLLLQGDVRSFLNQRILVSLVGQRS